MPLIPKASLVSRVPGQLELLHKETLSQRKHNKNKIKKKKVLASRSKTRGDHLI